MLNKSFGFLCLVLILGFQLSCQLAPTKVVETSNHEVQRLVEKAAKKIELTPQTLIIDSRSSFEYTMMHLPNSINLNAEHFSVNQAPAPGRLQEVQSIAKRLALKGISPDKPVVIVGDGIKGKAEEGRLAWMLFYLGFDDVQTASLSQFQNSLTNTQGEPRPNVPDWKPKLREGVDVSRKEFMASLEARTEGSKVFYVDARSKEEYFAKKGAGEAYKTPDFQAINIEWKEFFNDDGRPNQAMRSRLREVGIGLNDQVIVLSNKGYRSAAVTWALLALGFTKAANYTGGYTELVR